MIAVVTGSSGFIGSHLVDALLARGATVRVLARHETPEHALDPRVELGRADLTDDRSVREAGIWDGATHVFHLAGATKRRTLGEFRFANLVPTANVLAAVAAHTGETPPRVVLVSSQAAAGPAPAANRPVREDDVARPIEGYGRSKLEAETAGRSYEGRLPVSVVRPGAVYGPRDRDFMRVFKLASRAVAIHAVPRDNAFSIVHVRDVVAAILLAGERPEAIGRTFFVANEAPTTWRDMYAAIAEAADVSRAMELQVPLPAVALAGVAGDVVSALTGWHSLANGNKTRMARPRWWLCDASRIRAELGWHESIGLREGVRETYLWYLDAGWMRARAARRSIAIEGVAGVTHPYLLHDDARAAGISTLVELLEHRAARQPAEVVFRFLSGDGAEDGTLTFAELRERARAIAVGLAAVVAPGDRVVLLVPPGLEYVAAYFGCLYAGAVAVPAYPPNPRRADPRVSGIVADSGARVAMVSAGLASRLQGWLELNEGLSGVTWLEVSALAASDASPWRAPDLHRGSLAMLQYTSGSTGEPRGVMLDHANLLENSAVIHRVSAHREGDSGVFWLPPFHDMGLIGGIVQPVYAGRSAALMAPATFLQRPIRWLEAIARYRATTSGAPNFAYDLCVDRTTPEERAALDLSSWRTSFNGAEPVRADTMARFAEAFAVSGLRRGVIVPCYGLAESTLIVAGGPPDREPRAIVASRRALESGEVCTASPGEEATTMVASGEPARELEVAIVDPDSHERCADGVVGEIWVAGPSVSHGYWNRPLESATTFDASLAGSSSAYLRTGDLGAIVEGELVVTGRIKDLVILDGRNFYPHDIEVAADRSHPALRPGFSAAYSVAGTRGERLALALEVSRHHEPKDDATLFQAVRTELAASVGVVPDEIVLVRQNGIARTSSGKIQRGATRAAMLDGSLDVVGRWAPTRDDANDRDERALRGFVLRWLHDELQIDESRLGGDTPLAELGIDSLVAARLLVALEGRLGLRIEAARLWAQPTVDDLARHLVALTDGADVRGARAARRAPAITPDLGTDVADWPEYRALRDRLALLEQEGIESPFFQVHEGVTGSHAVIGGRRVLNFANYNYLGLSGDPDVTRAAQDAVARWGSSVSASRVVSGERPVHATLEREIAAFVGAEDALVYIGGHPANVSTISHLFGPEDVVLCDVLMHNSAMQGAEFSGARRLTFPHNDWSALDAMLASVRSQHRRALIVIEGVYSADGDVPDLASFVAVTRRHGAMLMVDEAHSLGVLGRTGRGIAEHAGVHPSSVDIWMGTLSKSLASCGGYIAGSHALIEYLKYTSPGFVYSVGIPPSNAAAALAALRKLIAEPERVATLRARAAYFLARCRAEGFDTGDSAGTPVIPVIVGDSLRAARLAAMMLVAGINVQPMVAPAVANEGARLRFFIASTHTERELETTVRLLAAAMRRLDDPDADDEARGAQAEDRSAVSA